MCMWVLVLQKIWIKSSYSFISVKYKKAIQGTPAKGAYEYSFYEVHKFVWRLSTNPNELCLSICRKSKDKGPQCQVEVLDCKIGGPLPSTKGQNIQGKDTRRRLSIVESSSSSMASSTRWVGKDVPSEDDSAVSNYDQDECTLQQEYDRLLRNLNIFTIDNQALLQKHVIKFCTENYDLRPEPKPWRLNNGGTCMSLLQLR